VRRASLLVLIAFAAGGCGGGGGGAGGGGGERLSRAQYASQADAICSKYNKRTKSLGSKVRNLSDLAKAFDRALPLLENALAELGTLKPPENEQHSVSLWLAQSQVLKHDLEQIRDRARAKDMKSVRSLFAKAQSDDQRGNELASKLGMKVCSKG
jgi:hypothetical protein